jgi:NAD(P)-dependent dehydrogenase (short-subunit alcohol dehydrogenase family)
VKRTLIITGGASGIGAATARIAAGQGYDIAVNFRSREQQAIALVDELRGTGVRAVAVRADVSVAADVERLFSVVDDAELGPLTALVNSAGVSLPGVSVHDADPAALERLMRTNVTGLMICCREAVRRMSTRRGGAGGVIVNVSSMAATIGGRPGSSHYAASKAAVDAYTVGLAKEVAPEGIRAVSVRPGFTVTDMASSQLSDPAFAAAIRASIPMARPARADEIAAPIAWLLSDDASFVSGACLDVSGGGFVVGSRGS